MESIQKILINNDFDHSKQMQELWINNNKRNHYIHLLGFGGNDGKILVDEKWKFDHYERWFKHKREDGKIIIMSVEKGKIGVNIMLDGRCAPFPSEKDYPRISTSQDWILLFQEAEKFYSENRDHVKKINNCIDNYSKAMNAVLGLTPEEAIGILQQFGF